MDDSFTIDPHTMGRVSDDLEMYIALCQEELNESFAENCKTKKLSVEQKALLPIYAQLVTAHALNNIETEGSFLADMLQPMLERLVKYGKL